MLVVLVGREYDGTEHEYGEYFIHIGKILREENYLSLLYLFH